MAVPQLKKCRVIRDSEDSEDFVERKRLQRGKCRGRAEGKFSDYFREIPHSLILLSRVL